MGLDQRNISVTVENEAREVSWGKQRKVLSSSKPWDLDSVILTAEQYRVDIWSIDYGTRLAVDFGQVA